MRPPEYTCCLKLNVATQGERWSSLLLLVSHIKPCLTSGFTMRRIHLTSLHSSKIVGKHVTIKSVDNLMFRARMDAVYRAIHRPFSCNISHAYSNMSLYHPMFSIRRAHPSLIFWSSPVSERFQGALAPHSDGLVQAVMQKRQRTGYNNRVGVRNDFVGVGCWQLGMTSWGLGVGSWE